MNFVHLNQLKRSIDCNTGLGYMAILYTMYKKISNIKSWVTHGTRPRLEKKCMKRKKTCPSFREGEFKRCFGFEKILYEFWWTKKGVFLIKRIQWFGLRFKSSHWVDDCARCTHIYTHRTIHYTYTIYMRYTYTKMRIYWQAASVSIFSCMENSTLNDSE